MSTARGHGKKEKRDMKSAATEMRSSRGRQTKRRRKWMSAEWKRAAGRERGVRRGRGQEDEHGTRARQEGEARHEEQIGRAARREGETDKKTAEMDERGMETRGRKRARREAR